LRVVWGRHMAFASSNPDIAKTSGFDPRHIEHISAVE
jgi:hypothetical protein